MGGTRRESPTKGADKEVEPGSLSSFRRLAKHLFGMDRAEFQAALKRDEVERRAKCGR